MQGLTRTQFRSANAAATAFAPEVLWLMGIFQCPQEQELCPAGVACQLYL